MSEPPPPASPDVLRAVAEGVEAATGAAFFPSLVRSLATALGVSYAYVTELSPQGDRFRPIAAWGRGAPLELPELALRGTPCESVLGGEIAHHPDGLRARFPADATLAEWNVVSYAGVPVAGPDGGVLGHLAVFDERPMPDGRRAIDVMRIFAARVHAERMRAEGEAAFRALYEDAPVAYMLFDAEARIRRVNRAFTAMSGFEPEEVLGLAVENLVHPDDRELLELSFADAREGRVAARDVRGLRKDGSVLWVRGVARAVRNADGDLRGYFNIVVDLSSLKQAEADLREREALYRDLYDRAPLAYATFGRDGTLRTWNRRLLELTGYTEEEIRSRPSFAPLHPDAPEVRAAMHRLEEEVYGLGRDITTELPSLRADGTEYWAEISVSPLRDAEGAIVGGRSIAQDVTERRRIRQALVESEAQLKAVVDGAMDAIFVYDEDFRVVRWNRAAERMFRCPAAEAVGTSVLRFTTAEAAEVLKATIERLPADPNAGYSPPGLLARRADGETFAFEATVSRAIVNGRPLFIGVMRDIEDRLRSERETQRLARQSDYLQEEIKASHDFESIVGRSDALAGLLGDVALVARTDSTVLVTGETGSGKELVARAIHSQSGRRDRPLVKLNCAALPAGLVESELFGHEKGAFTGALHRRTGRFELADGGTLFLDEIGEVPPEVQAKLLRVLQEQEFERVGGSQTLRVDVRVIAATNRDLAQMVEAGRFRADLYYRLAVFPLRVPPLRERAGDVALLAHFFLTRHAARIGRPIERIAPATLARLEAYPWPGNVRELENVIERSVILCTGPVLEVPEGMLPGAPEPQPALRETAAPAPPSVPRHEGSPAAAISDVLSLDEAQRRHILEMLERSGGRIEGPGGAAALLGLRPSTLRSRIRKLGIRRS